MLRRDGRSAAPGIGATGRVADHDQRVLSMRWMLDQTALGRSHTKQPAAESKLLSGALALGADVVCVAEEPGPGPRLAVALGAVNIWIAPQGHVVDADGASQDHKKHKEFQRSVLVRQRWNKYPFCRKNDWPHRGARRVIHFRGVRDQRRARHLM